MILVVILFAILIPNGTAEKIRVINFNGKQSTTTESLRYLKDDADVTATRETTFCFRFMLRYSRGMLLIKTNQVQFTIMDQVWPIVKCFLFASPKNLGGQVKSMAFSLGGHGSLLPLLVTRLRAFLQIKATFTDPIKHCNSPFVAPPKLQSYYKVPGHCSL